jgi:hypothetical protein
LALHFSDYSFLVHHLVNRDDRQLLAHAMASDFRTILLYRWVGPERGGGKKIRLIRKCLIAYLNFIWPALKNAMSCCNSSHSWHQRCTAMAEPVHGCLLDHAHHKWMIL